MLRKDKNGGNLRGISVCRQAPLVSNLLFADDCIVFYNASIEEGLRVTKIPEDYEKESGQKLNREKTSSSFIFLFFLFYFFFKEKHKCGG